MMAAFDKVNQEKQKSKEEERVMKLADFKKKAYDMAMSDNAKYNEFWEVANSDKEYLELMVVTYESNSPEMSDNWAK
jgi:hypothetical protein